MEIQGYGAVQLANSVLSLIQKGVFMVGFWITFVLVVLFMALDYLRLVLDGNPRVRRAFNGVTVSLCVMFLLLSGTIVLPKSYVSETKQYETLEKAEKDLGVSQDILLAHTDMTHVEKRIEVRKHELRAVNTNWNWLVKLCIPSRTVYYCKETDM